MPLSNVLKSAADSCPLCHQKTGIIDRARQDCQETFEAGWTEMVAIAAEATGTHDLDEKTLFATLAEIAGRSYGDGATVNEALEEGWEQGVAHSMADGIITQAEEAKLRVFRAPLANLAVDDPNLPP